MMWTIALPFLAAFLAIGLGSPKGLPGGVTDTDPNDPEFRKAVDVAVKEFNAQSDQQHYYSLAAVLSSQVQVVQGINYIMTLVLGKTICIKGILSIDCPIIRGSLESKFYRCSFTVWSWNNELQVTGSKCKN